MKRALFLTMAIAAFLVPRETEAQGQQNFERINSYKIAFFTRRLNLTSAEAEKFWPVYNEYDNKRIKLQQERAETMRTVNQNEMKMSDGELLKAADKLVSLQVDEAMLTDQLHQKLKTILPAAKVLRVYQAENMFRNQLLNDLKENREIRRDPTKRNFNQ